MIKELQTRDFNVTPDKIQIKGVKGPGMILIHQKWCGYCVRFLPIYAQLDSHVGRSFPLVAVEGDAVDPKITSRLVDQGFPTIKFFDKNGFVSRNSYNGNRDLKSLMEYICNTYHTCKK
jgi:thiol-disulfide isomerase/thioredoxin